MPWGELCSIGKKMIINAIFPLKDSEKTMKLENLMLILLKKKLLEMIS
jgi:hypothetical protein